MVGLKTIKLIVLGLTAVLFVMLSIVVWALIHPEVLTRHSLAERASVAGNPNDDKSTTYCSRDENDEKWVMDTLPGTLVTTHAAGPYVAAVITKALSRVEEGENSGAVAVTPVQAKAAEIVIETVLIDPCTGLIVGEIR